MKKSVLIAILFLTTLTSFSQYRGTRQNGTLVTTEDYVTNSPGNSISNSKLIARYKDSTSFDLHYNNVRFAKYITSKNDGVPTSILWTDANGNIKKSPIPSWITSETDPQWLIEKDNYYTKSLSDARYLQGFTEVDGSVTNEIELPSQTGQSGKILTTNGTVASWITSGSGSGTVTSVSSSDVNASVSSGTTNAVISVLSAPKLQTVRTIQGVNFDGTTNINLINGTGFLKASGTTLSYDNSTYITANQNITLSGDVTGSGTTAITATLSSVGTSGTYGLVTTDSKGRVVSGKRQEVYSGVTNASGVYTVSFGTTYSVSPNIQASIINATDTQNIRITSVTTTGFTVLVRNRVDVVGLLPTWANVNAANVDVLITEK